MSAVSEYFEQSYCFAHWRALRFAHQTLGLRALDNETAAELLFDRITEIRKLVCVTQVIPGLVV
jgi:hypothetical protein